MKPILSFVVSATLLFGSVIAQEKSPIQLQTSDNQTQAISEWIGENLATTVDTYKHLHTHPELSFQEFKTSTLVAKSWKKAGFEVTQGIGRTGVVGVLKNGAGPTILIRGDMDALPVLEQTGLPYASKVQRKEADGTILGTMHACGHDVHVAMIISMGQMLSTLRDQWRGTVVMVAQPAEELGLGAKAMIEDGLFERFPKPDYCLALHVIHNLPVGAVGLTSGYAFANVDSVDITIFGKGGHGARPQNTIDPIVTAAQVVTALQTIVSRRLEPSDPGVVTVGSIHGGTKHNIIPDEVKLELTVRSYTDEVRKTLLDGIRQITTDTCKAMNCPKEPLVKIKDGYTPAAYNDPGLTKAASGLFSQLLGQDNVFELPPTMGGEDFGRYALHLGVPGLQYRIGGIPREKWEASKKPDAAPLPSIHSPLFYPEPEETMELSLKSMGNLAMGLLAKP